MVCKKYRLEGGEEARLYSYVVRWDRGLAPNPFWGFCTLACYKPRIREKVGDWVVGTGSKNTVEQNKLVYAAKVTEKVSFEQYSAEKRFRRKIPGAGRKRELGDNIYYWEKGKPMRHPFSERNEMEKDLKGK